jgi:CubicO group peptidase (beta-lactamase class C family)
MHEREFHSAWAVGDDPLRTSGAASALFPWWSFTKTVLGVCVLRLWEQARLELHERLPGQPFTPHHLLQNRAGVPNYGHLPAYHGAVARGDTPWSRQELLDRVQADRLDFEPGTGWSYSNVGFLLVRELIEERTGQDLGAVIAALVTGPLGLASVRLARSATEFREVHWEAVRGYDPRWVYHGCLIGTTGNACRLLQALFAGRLLRPKTLDLMLQRHHLGGDIPGRPWTSHGYALGLMSGAVRTAGRAIGHSGSGPGCVNAVYHFPDLPRPVTVASFTDGNDEGQAEWEALSIASRPAL